MVWSKAKDLILLKEIAAEGVMSNKPWSRERGMQWQRVANNISVLGQGVTLQAVRDHYNVMAKRYRAKMAQEERSTGEGGAELTEAESLLEELIHIEGEMERQVESENEENQQSIEQEPVIFVDIFRQLLMKRITHTNIRKALHSSNLSRTVSRKGVVLMPTAESS